MARTVFSNVLASNLCNTGEWLSGDSVVRHFSALRTGFLCLDVPGKRPRRKRRGAFSTRFASKDGAMEIVMVHPGGNVTRSA